jgi:hypothetical protein
VSAFATPSPSKISRYSRYGSWQVLAEADFRRGLVTDTSPVAIPAGGIVDVRDYLFDRPGRVRKRGGTVYANSAMGTSNSVTHVAFVPFASVQKLVAITATLGGGGVPSSFFVFDAGGGGAVIVGASGPNNVPNPPVFYNDTLYVIGGSVSAPGRPQIVRCVAGALTLADSVAPASLVGCTHSGYLVLANDAASHQNRLWFSPIPDPETAWDTANAYIDTNGPITGLASVQGVLIVFHAGSSERILGAIPPGTPAENMSLQPLSGQAGCIDPGSIKSLAGNVYFADQSGVWVTNGASVTSITSRSDATGVSSLWRTQISRGGGTIGVGYGAGMAVRGGTFGNDYYLVNILAWNAGASRWDTLLFLVYHVATGIWSRLSIAAIGEFSASTSALETYAAPVHAGRVLLLSDLFAETPTAASDADGTVVAPTLTSRVMGTGPFEKAFGDGHLTYDMRSSSGATLALTYSRDIEQQSFQSSFTFPGVAAPTRQRFPVSGDGHGFTWKITQTGASSKTELYAVELEHRNYEEQADG